MTRMLWLLWTMYHKWVVYHCVKQTLEKVKVHRLEKYKSKFLISEVPTLWSLRTDLQEETERQQRCARSKAWNFAKNKCKVREKDKATFYSPTEEWVLPTAETKEPEEREIAVDSGASVHMVSKRDLNTAELETVRTSRSPTTVMTANGEVRTNEEATTFVKQLDLFDTVMLLQEIRAVLSLGKLCEEHGYTCQWTSSQNPHVIKNGKRIDCNWSNYVPFVVPWISASSSSTTPSSASSLSSSQESTSTNNNSVSEDRDVEAPVSERNGGMNEELQGDPLHDSTETKSKIEIGNTKKYQEKYRINCLIGYRKSGRIRLMKVLLKGVRRDLMQWSADTSSSSHDPPMQPRAHVELASGKHSVFTALSEGSELWKMLEDQNNKNFWKKTR